MFDIHKKCSQKAFVGTINAIKSIVKIFDRFLAPQKRKLASLFK